MVKRPEKGLQDCASRPVESRSGVRETILAAPYHYRAYPHSGAEIVTPKALRGGEEGIWRVSE